MNDELELKYTVLDLEALREWLDRTFPTDDRQGVWREQEMVDIYFDTADERLASAGHGARLRTIAGATVVGLKSDLRLRGSVHQRLELEAPAANVLDPSVWPPSEVRELVARVVRGVPLEERFALRQVRRERTHRPRDGAAVLLSLDRVEVLHGGRQLGELLQLEAELRSGPADVLYEMARLLESSGLVQPEPLSKMALAEALVAAGEPAEAGEAAS